MTFTVEIKFFDFKFKIITRINKLRTEKFFIFLTNKHVLTPKTAPIFSSRAPGAYYTP